MDCVGPMALPVSSTPSQVFERRHLKQDISKVTTLQKPTTVSPKNVLTRKRLAREVADLLNLPKLGWKGKAYEVVDTIIRAIVNGIVRDGSVKIDGFGIFTIYERPATRSPVYFYPRLGKGQHWEILSLPPTKRVIFKPSKPLLRLLNHAD